MYEHSLATTARVEPSTPLVTLGLVTCRAAVYHLLEPKHRQFSNECSYSQTPQCQ